MSVVRLARYIQSDLWSRHFLSEFPVKLRAISSPAQISTMSSCRRVSRELISSWSSVRQGGRFLSCLSLLRIYLADFFLRISRNTRAGNMHRMACERASCRSGYKAGKGTLEWTSCFTLEDGIALTGGTTFSYITFDHVTRTTVTSCRISGNT